MKKKQLWNLFIGKDEYDPLITDRFDRIFSYSVTNKNLFEPVVSKYIYNQGFSPVYPENKQFAVALTHDIDILFENNTFKKSFNNLVKSFSKNKELFKNSLNSLFRKQVWKEYNTKRIREIDEKYNAKSTFFFFSTDKEYKEFNYNVPDVKYLLDDLTQNGNEVGLHGSYMSYKDKQKMYSEKKRLNSVLNKNVIGFRNHNLNFNIRCSYSNLINSGFKYDATYGFPDVVGFRNGMCYPFQPYDLNNEKYYDIIEFPLHIMDLTLFNYYMRLDFEKAFVVFKIIVGEVEKYNGVLNFLWHNNNMTGNQLEFYESCLGYLKDKNAWITSCENIYNHYTEMNYFKQITGILESICKGV